MIRRLFKLVAMKIEITKMKFKLFKTIMSMTPEQTEFSRKLAKNAIDKSREDKPNEKETQR